MEITIKPLPRQHLAWEALQNDIQKYIVFGGGAGGGKTWLGCEWLLTNCYFYPGSKWFIGRNELKRLMGSAFETWRKVCQFHKVPEDDWKLNGQYNFIEFTNGSRIDLLDVKEVPSDPMFERFGSLEYTGGWLEEAGEIKFRAFDVLKSRIGRHLNKEFNLSPKMLITCNPKKNWLKRVVYNPYKEGTLSEKYIYIQSLYSDNHYTSDLYGENLSEITDLATRQRLKEGNWDYDEEDGTLVDYDAIMDIWKTQGREGGKYLTADIARFGKDKTVVYLWQGWQVYKRLEFLHKDTKVTAQELDDIMSKEGIQRRCAIVDEVGVGGGVVDNLRGVNGFIANSSALEPKDAKKNYRYLNGKLTLVTPKENFKSLKDQCGFRIAERLNNREIGMVCKDEKIRELIEEEIGELKDAKPDEEVKKQLIPKDDIKENIGRSPDDLDALIMREYFELLGFRERRKRHQRRKRLKTSTGYNFKMTGY